MQKSKILDEITDNIAGKIKDNYSPRYYTQRVTQSKSRSFYLVLRKKQGRLTQVEKGNLNENVQEFVENIYKFYSRRCDFFFFFFFFF